MENRDTMAKYICDKIAATLTKYGRTVKREGEHALLVSIKPFAGLAWWRIVVRRTGSIEFEPLDNFAKNRPIPSLQDHIADALADEFEYTAGKDSNGDRVVMQPRALPNAPYALPAAT